MLSGVEMLDAKHTQHTLDTAINQPTKDLEASCNG